MIRILVALRKGGIPYTAGSLMNLVGSTGLAITLDLGDYDALGLASGRVRTAPMQ